MSLSISSFQLRPMLLAAGLSLAAVGAAFAADVGVDRPHRDHAERMAEHLALDDSQKAGVSAILERNRPAQQKLRERSKAHWQAMKALKPGTPDYTTRAQTLADEAGTLARDRVLNRTQLNAELATVLTPEQIGKMHERKGHRGHHGHHGHRGGRHHQKRGGDTATPATDATS